ncbi:MAG: hypothetical protein ACYCUG_12010 [Acidimicrobiales bacterium]
MNDPAINAGDAVYALQADGSLKQVGTATQNGTVTVSFTTDPAFVVTPPVAGYWLAGPTGHVTVYGDARSYGSAPAGMSGVVAFAATADGKGYWLATAAGQVLATGDAPRFVAGGPGPVVSLPEGLLREIDERGAAEVHEPERTAGPGGSTRARSARPRCRRRGHGPLGAEVPDGREVRVRDLVRRDREHRR